MACLVPQVSNVFISNGEEVTQKLNQICKGKGVAEPLNNNTDQMDVDQVIIGCRHDERCILLLWNPSTGESTVLPDPEFPPIGRSSCLGLGYDSTSGDYKILQVQPIGRGPSEVLALNSGSWRKIDKHPRGICNYLNLTHSMAFVHEAFHWIGCFGNNFMPPRHLCVATFSISNEVYSELPLPEQIMRGNFAIGISVLEGMLCVHSDSISSANLGLHYLL